MGFFYKWANFRAKLIRALKFDATAGTSTFNNVTDTVIARFGVGVNPEVTAGEGMEISYSVGPGTLTLTIYDRTGAAYKNLAIDAAMFSVKSKFYPPKDDATFQTAAGIYAGSGAPNNSNGANGDFYFRSDGTVGGNTVAYHKEAGAWVAFVTA